MQGVKKLERKQKAAHYLQLVGLEKSAKLLPHQLSGGMRQRAAIARALAADPQIILMDEPFGALDAITRNSMQDHLRGIWEQTRKTVFFITHDVEEALLLATRIIVMHAHPGQIVQDISNPFADTLGRLPAAELRLSSEFVKMREQLVASIHQDRGNSSISRE